MVGIERSDHPIHHAPALRTILRAGLIAGALDITAALIFYARFGTRTVLLLQHIASGVLGPPAFRGGAATALLGLLLHFFIATSAAAVYYAASRRLPGLVAHPFVSGALYGPAVFFFMDRVVVQLSAIGPRPLPLSYAVEGVLIHIFCVGLPIALTVRRFATGASTPDSPSLS